MRLTLLVLLTMTAFAANSVLNRMAVGAGAIEPVAFAAVRVVSGAVVLAAIATARAGTAWLIGARPAASLALTLYMLGFSVAYLSLDTGTGALILFGGVQVTMFAGAVIAREPVPRRRWAGTVIATLGLALLVGGIALGPGQLWAAVAMSAAALGWGIYSLIGRTARDPLGATAASFVLSVPIVAVALALAGWGAPSPGGVALAVASGAVTSGLGYALWYALLPALDRTTAALSQLSVPLLAAAGGVALLGEPITWRMALAAALIVGGVLLGVLPRRAQRTIGSSGS